MSSSLRGIDDPCLTSSVRRAHISSSPNTMSRRVGQLRSGRLRESVGSGAEGVPASHRSVSSATNVVRHGVHCWTDPRAHGAHERWSVLLQPYERTLATYQNHQDAARTHSSPRVPGAPPSRRTTSHWMVPAAARLGAARVGLGPWRAAGASAGHAPRRVS